MSMKKLAYEIQHKQEIELTERFYKELKLESKIDFIILKMVIQILLEDEMFIEMIKEDNPDEILILDQMVLSLMPIAAERIGSLIEGIELTEDNAKELGAALDEKYEEEYINSKAK